MASPSSVDDLREAARMARLVLSEVEQRIIGNEPLPVFDPIVDSLLDLRDELEPS